MRKASPDTIEGLIKEGYESCVLKDHPMETIIPASGIKVFYESERKGFNCDSRAVTAGKFVSFMARIPLTTYKQHVEFKTRDMGHDDTPIKFIKENIHKATKGIMVVKNEIYWKPIHDAIQRLFEAGITKMLPYNKFGIITLFRHFDVYDKNELEPTVLTLEILDAGFYVWLVSLAISMLVFFGEFIVHRIQMKVREKNSIIQVRSLKQI